jgi:hypothetical protein
MFGSNLGNFTTAAFAASIILKLWLQIQSDSDKRPGPNIIKRFTSVIYECL